MSHEEPSYRRMQVKVLYSFNNTGTVFLSRSKSQYSVKVAQIPMDFSSNPLQSQEQELITLGAFDLKTCTQQILKSSPENFHLNIEDYAVYYKDLTEQPDEPFVSQGVMSNLLKSSKPHLIPGRVCQNLSASFLFGDKANTSSLTLEIRLKLHTIERTQMSNQECDSAPTSHKRSNVSDSVNHFSNQKKQRHSNPTKPLSHPTSMSPVATNSASSSSSSSSAAIKATRTKSLPIFYHPRSQQVFNIINADKLNAPSKYDSKSVQDRFKSAPFLQAKIIDNPASKRKRSVNGRGRYYNSTSANNNNNPASTTAAISTNERHENESTTPVDPPQRAIRTRSMITSHPIISSPINEEMLSDETDDTEYNENQNNDETQHFEDLDEEDDEEEDGDYENDLESSSPYTPQQPPYKPSSAPVISSNNNQFHSLPALEDLDSKKTHTIPDSKLPKDHGLVCTNSNCATTHSITWRYFETKFQPNYLAIHRNEHFDKKNYEGMFGPLCNACYLFLRNKGFMRPEGVVKKYLQQQKYKREGKQKDGSLALPPTMTVNSNGPSQINSSSPINPPTGQSGKFLTPSHTPSAINQAILNNNYNSNNNSNSAQNTNHLHKPNYNDLTDFMNQLNSFGGPLTDIDPLPQDNNQHQQGITPPMMATKSNTRVINIYDEAEGEDKENWPPLNNHVDDDDDDQHNFDKMIAKSFSSKECPENSEWSTLFEEPTPKDHTTPKNPEDKPVTNYSQQGQIDQRHQSTSESHLPPLRTFRSSPLKLDKTSAAVNMPSSPLLSSNIQSLEDEVNNMVANEMLMNNSSSPATHASRLDTVMSYNHHLAKQSSPSSDFYSNDDAKR